MTLVVSHARRYTCHVLAMIDENAQTGMRRPMDTQGVMLGAKRLSSQATASPFALESNETIAYQT